MLCIKIVKLLCVRIPQHIAIIMDGNRRFARRGGMETTHGHLKGFDKLSEALKWCIELGVKELTVFAFSIENFKRSADEVAALTQLAEQKLQLLLSTINDMNASGVRVNVVGRWELLSESLQELSARVMLATRRNCTLTLNIAYAYTGRDEISRAASALVSAVRRGELAPEDIDEALVSRTLQLGAPALLLRTSGEVRLSDFMLWQVSSTVLYFTETLWPEFTLYGLLGAVIHFQMHARDHEIPKPDSDKKTAFLTRLETQRWMGIEELAKRAST